MSIFYPLESFSINGTSLSSVEEIQWGEISLDKSEFTVVSDFLITGIVPPQASSSFVYALDSEDQTYELGFVHVGLKEETSIQISGFSPQTGYGLETISISGSNFYNIDEVAVNGVSSSYEVINENLIQVSPEQSFTTGPISVKTFSKGLVFEEYFPSGLNPEDLNSEYSLAVSTGLLEIAPKFDELSHSTKKAGGFVSLRGQNLRAVSSLYLNDKEAEVQSLTNDSLVFAVPEGNVDGFLKADYSLGDTQLTETFTSPNMYFYSSFGGFAEPSELKGGDELRIYGDNLYLDTLFLTEDGQVRVNIGGEDVGFSIEEGEYLEGFFPKGLDLGETPITLFNKEGLEISEISPCFNLGDLPVLSYSNIEKVAIGETVQINGSYLTEVNSLTLTFEQESFDVSDLQTDPFGNYFTFVLPEELQMYSENGSRSGYIDIVARKPIGESNTLGQAFYLIGKPFIDLVVNPDEKKASSSLVTLIGNNLESGNSVFIYDQDGSVIKETSLISSNAFVLPSDFEDSPVAIKVSNRLGDGNLSDYFEVTKKPLVSGFEPISGFPGTKVSVSGDLADFVSLSLNGEKVETVLIDDNNLEFYYPEFASSSDLFVRTSGGESFSDESFNLIRKQPFISGFSTLDFIRGDSVSVTGSDIDLVENVLLNDKNNNPINIFSFNDKNSYSLNFSIPESVSSNLNNSIVIVDVFGRQQTLGFSYNVPVEIKNVSGNYSSFSDSGSYALNNISSGYLEGHGFLSVESLSFSGEALEIRDINRYNVISDNLLEFSISNTDLNYDFLEEEKTGNIQLILGLGQSQSAVESFSGNFQLINDFEVGSFFPTGGVFGSFVTSSGIGYADIDKIYVGGIQVNFDGENDERYFNIPVSGLLEGQKTLIQVEALGKRINFEDHFDLISTIPSLNFKVLESNPAVNLSSSSIFTVIETNSQGRWYVTKVSNPDNTTSIVSSELIT